MEIFSWIVFGLIFTLKFTFISTSSDCIFNKQLKDHIALDKFRKIAGKRYSVNDNYGEYTYKVGLCVDAEETPLPNTGAGIVQRKLSSPTKATVVGKYTVSSFMAGSNWFLLEYRDGDKYSAKCGNEPRRGAIMINCDKNDWQGTLNLVEENTNKTGECYFLFELTHSAVCDGATLAGTGLSAGWIFTIVFLTLIGVYFIFGFLYQRFVAGAKGWEQFPNASFWQDFGNLLADGCELVCRTGNSPRQQMNDPATHEYRGIGDDQLQDDDFDRDDNLLPM